MLKKIISLGFTIIMIYSFTGCGLENGIEEYRITAKNIIQDYADKKVQNDYTDENWETLLQAVENGMTAVDTAKKKIQADSVVKTAKYDIDDVETI